MFFTGVLITEFGFAFKFLLIVFKENSAGLDGSQNKSNANKQYSIPIFFLLSINCVITQFSSIIGGGFLSLDGLIYFPASQLRDGIFLSYV